MKQVWVPQDTTVFEIASIIEEDLDLNQISCQLSSGVVQNFSRAQTHAVDPTHLLDLDDLCFMNNLHEAPLLDMVRRRLAEDKIYTFTSNFLISLNPYKSIGGLYGEPLRYLDLREEVVGSTAEPKVPHVYTIANSALRALARCAEGQQNQNQSIIVTGESGAG